MLSIKGLENFLEGGRGVKMAILSTKEPIFSKGCIPMGVEIFSPNILTFRSLGTVKGLKKSNSIALLQFQIKEYSVLIC